MTGGQGLFFCFKHKVSKVAYGRIEKWVADRGFGFIGDDQDRHGPAVFVHISALGGVAPQVGDAFEYDVVEGRDGRGKAANLRPLTAAREEADRVFGHYDDE